MARSPATQAGRSAPRVSWLLACLALLACRSHSQLCEGVECVEGGGSAGAPAAPPAGEGGVGGASELPPSAECSDDSDCDDDDVCDGVESCVDGRCLEGRALVCSHGTRCDPAQPEEPCVYEQASPWLLVTTPERVLALPRLELGRRAPIVLAERRGANAAAGFAGSIWSRDGARALFFAREVEDGFSLRLLSFGAGLPAPPVVLPDVPSWLSWDYGGEPRFSPDGSRLMVDSQDAGVFLVTFGQPIATARVDAEPGPLCAGSASWLSPAGLATLTGAGLELREWSEWPSLAPDGRWLVELGEDARLLPCGPEGDGVPLGAVDSATWSPSSRHLAVSRDDGTLAVLSVMDPARPVEVWSQPGGYLERFDAGGLVAVIYQEEEERYAWLELDGDAPASARPLALEPSATLLLVSPEALLAKSYDPETGDDRLLWLPLAGGGPAELVSSAAGSFWPLAARAERGRAVIERSTDAAVEALWVRFDGHGWSVDSLTEAPYFGYFDLAGDDSGIVGIAGLSQLAAALWFPLDASGAPLPAVEIAPGANHAVFQPWR